MGDTAIHRQSRHRSNPSDSGSGDTSVDVRYRLGSTFTEVNWAGASQATGEPTPPATGMTVSNLSCNTTYAFALKTVDGAGNSSAISNAVTQSTSPCPTAPAIRVIAPNGGDVWAIGSNQTIQWTSNEFTGNVTIALSRDGGTTWKTLVNKTANDGSQSWKVTRPATTRARIRVCSVQTPTICDASDADFRIQ